MADKNRRLKFWMVRHWIVISERTAYLPHGYKNRKWDESRVALTRIELVHALALMDATASSAHAKGGKL